MIEERIISIANKLEKKLVKSTAAIQEEINQLVLELIYEFEIKNGRFVPQTDAAFVIATLNRRIKEIIDNSQLETEVLKFIDDFDAIDENITKLQMRENGIRLNNSIFNAQKVWAIDNTINSLLESNISTKFIQPVKKILYSRVMFGSTVVDAEKQLRSIIMGNKGELGVFEKWVGQIARDSVFEYQGAVNSQIKVEYELNAIRYVGGLVEDSRCQCRRWVDKYDGLLTDEILPKEIAWAYKYGSGMKPDTTPENFAQKRGGFNCTHLAIPTRSEVKQTFLGGTSCD